MLPLSLLSVHFSWVPKNFVDLSLNCVPHMIIKSIVIWGVRRREVRGVEVTEIFSRPKLGSFARVAWCSPVVRRRVFQWPPSRSRTELPSSITLIETSEMDLRLWGKIDGGEISNTMLWTGCLLFKKINRNLSSVKHFEIFILITQPYGMPFSNFWRTELCHKAAFL